MRPMAAASFAWFSESFPSVAETSVRDFVTKSAEYLDYLPEAVRRVLAQVTTEQRLAESEAWLAHIIDSAKEASRQRLRPILMTSFAFVFGVLPMARATGAGAYSRNALGIVIAFGIAVSTVLGRFVIPIYYVLGERLRGQRGVPTRPRASIASPVAKSTVPSSRPSSGHEPSAAWSNRSRSATFEYQFDWSERSARM